MILLIGIVLYIPVYLYAWRHTLRAIAEEDKGIKDGYDLLGGIAFATLVAVVVPPAYIVIKSLEYIDRRIKKVGVDKVVRVLAGESEHTKAARQMREKTCRAKWILDAEKELRLGDHKDLETIDGKGE